MWVIPHQETGVACSRNSPPSPAGRPSAVLLHRAFSEPTGGHNVRYKSTAVSPSTSTASFFVCLYQRPLFAPAPNERAASNASASRVFSPSLFASPSGPMGHIYVNRGLGTVGAPVRLGVPPEISLIVLRTA